MNKSIEKAGLRGLPQLYLVEIERTSGHRIPAVSPTEILEAGDVLWFTGVLESVASLRKIAGLVAHGDQVKKLNHSKQERRLVEAVISPISILVCVMRFFVATLGVNRSAKQSEKVALGHVSMQPSLVRLPYAAKGNKGMFRSASSGP